MPDCLNYESTHIQISYILYFIKVCKLPTLKGQCTLEVHCYQIFTRHKPVLRQNNK